MSGAVCGFADLYGDKEGPIVTIVEPEGANCIFRTAKANDGKLILLQKICTPLWQDYAAVYLALPVGISCVIMPTILSQNLILQQQPA